MSITVNKTKIINFGSCTPYSYGTYTPLSCFTPGYFGYGCYTPSPIFGDYCNWYTPMLATMGFRFGMNLSSIIKGGGK